ncbi:MAG: ribosome maturation factor RimP [Mycobacterium sp.]
MRTTQDEELAVLPTQAQVLELLTDAFADAGYDIEDVRVQADAKPARIVVVADSDDGLNLDIVAELSRSASDLLDQVTVEADAYVLEVTSPGVERPLTTVRHFRRAHGRKIDLTLSDGTSLQARVGRSDGVEVDLVIAERGKLSVRRVAIADITKAIVQVEFSPPNRRELELAGVTREEADE